MMEEAYPLEFLTLDTVCIEDVVALAQQALDHARRTLLVLPDADFSCTLQAEIQALFSAENGRGLAVAQNGKLVGYMAFCGVRPNFFGTSKGTFSPICGNAVDLTLPERDRVRLADALCARLMDIQLRELGITSVAPAFYANDQALLTSFVCGGFGLRCCDLMQHTKKLLLPQTQRNGYTLRRVLPQDAAPLYPLNRALDAHLMASPCYLALTLPTLQSFMEEKQAKDALLYAAFDAAGNAVGYVECCHGGENYLAEAPNVRSVCGAYIDPGVRGAGLLDALLALAAQEALAENFLYMGVDCETLNPVAYTAWKRRFVPYTYTVTVALKPSVGNVNEFVKDTYTFGTVTFTVKAVTPGIAGNVVSTGSTGTTAGTVADTTSTTDYTVTASKLNLRAAAVNGKVVAQAVRGSSLKVISVDNGWAKIDYNGQTLYASMSYLVKAGTTTGDGAVIARVLNVRAGASTDTRILGKLNRGTTVKILSSANGWGEISINGVKAYVSLAYIQFK